MSLTPQQILNDHSIRVNIPTINSTGIMKVDNIFYRFSKDPTLDPNQFVVSKNFHRKSSFPIDVCSEYLDPLIEIKSCNITVHTPKEQDVVYESTDIIRIFSGIPINQDMIYTLSKEISISFNNIKPDINGCMVLGTRTRFNHETLFKEGFSYKDIASKIGGFEELFKKVYTTVLLPRMLSPEVRKKMNLELVKGVIIDGPPGCGKTLFVKSLTDVMNCKVKLVKGPEILGKYVGESEQNVRLLFEDAIKNPNQLYVIVLDEFDSIAGKRSSGESSSGRVNNNIVNQLLTMIDGVERINNVILFGLTNLKDLIDDAILRDGRFGLHITVGLPDFNSRIDILKIRLKGIIDVDFNKLSMLTNGFTGAEIMGVVNSTIAKSLESIVDFDNLNKEINEINLTEQMLIEQINRTIPKYRTFKR